MKKVVDKAGEKGEKNLPQLLRAFLRLDGGGGQSRMRGRRSGGFFDK